jgi:1,4-alpha-glucan branching enzyme
VTSLSPDALHRLAAGRHATPFDVLGAHRDEHGTGWIVRVWAPGARRVVVLVENPRAPELEGPGLDADPLGGSGIFEVWIQEAPAPPAYRVVVDGSERHDPYRFAPVHGEADFARLTEPDGRAHEVLGAHLMEHQGVEGTLFSVWAPAARAVSVVGSFNRWSAAAHPMRSRGASGVWELFVPGVAPGELYKYHIVSHATAEPILKADPYGRAMQLRPDSASVVVGPSKHSWQDDAWIQGRDPQRGAHEAVSIYEVHLSSWRRAPGARPREGVPGWRTYREIANELVPYVAELGFTHIELLPITEHPYDGSWGYQTVGYFAPTARHGSPDDLRYLVDKAHAAGIGVILDWVPAHFPRDAHGLGRFDGTALYEHGDPRQGVHPDWGTYIFDYGRPQVVSFLVSSALYWIEEFHIDGLRLDAVASMLYLDYSRDEGAWVANEFGGRENLDAVAFLRTLNETVHAEHPGVTISAEESTAWPGVSHPVAAGGLGFDLKWNMGWMHDTLEFMETDPLFRKGSYDKLTFGITYAYAERFLLPFSHDEVVHLKGSMLRKMPGAPLNAFASLRLLYGYMWTQPGKKLLFMGGELATWHEWDAEGTLDWPLLKAPMHQGVAHWVSTLNRAYKEIPALHELDWSGHGFEWIDCHDAQRTTLAWIRWTREWEDFVVVVCNFTPVAWADYRLAVPFPGRYRVVLDSGDEAFGGGGAVRPETLESVDEPHLGRNQHLLLTLPPLTILVLEMEEEDEA